MQIGLATQSQFHQNFLISSSVGRSPTYCSRNFIPTFTKKLSPLNPLKRPSGSPQLLLNTHKPLESIHTHLSNLQKLLKPTQESAIPKILPAAEEMSPRNLNRLKRLLSMSQQYSPRDNLASRWREYHGCNDWNELLDPLDDNLRREVVKYGEFVQGAYQAFQSNPAATSESSLQVELSDKSYKVTKSLYATSSISLPGWINTVKPDLSWLTQRSSWVGFVAVCDDPKEIARMGRRDIVISLRGTSTCLEWVENVRDLLVQIPGEEEKGHSKPKVECGFLSLYKTPGSIPGALSLSESIVGEVQRLIELYKDETLSISISGHSLGAALALLAADELSTCASHMSMPPIAVYSFGGPRVGNRGFANKITRNGVKVLRVVNSQDMVTRVPGMFVNETLDRKLRESKAANLLHILDNNVPWAYSHVGSELRVDSKISPYLKPNADVSCCHDLEAYLHLVDGFTGSNCPFRANAKRSLAKLLHEQGSNMKKLYTSKAHGLKLSLDGGKFATDCIPSPS